MPPVPCAVKGGEIHRVSLGGEAGNQGSRVGNHAGCPLGREHVLFGERLSLAPHQPQIHEPVEGSAQNGDRLGTTYAEPYLARNMAVVVLIGVVGDVGDSGGMK